MPRYRVEFTLDGYVEVDGDDALEASYKAARGFGPDGIIREAFDVFKLTVANIQGNPEVID